MRRTYKNSREPRRPKKNTQARRKEPGSFWAGATRHREERMRSQETLKQSRKAGRPCKNPAEHDSTLESPAEPKRSQENPGDPRGSQASPSEPRRSQATPREPKRNPRQHNVREVEISTQLIEKKRSRIGFGPLQKRAPKRPHQTGQLFARQ